jgi:hypothetical protein
LAWLPSILSPLRRLIGRAAGTPAEQRPAVADHQLRRRMVESLEPRQLMADATFGGLTFHLASPDATKDAQLTDLFTRGADAPVASVSYAGTIGSGDQSVSGNFTVSASLAGTFSVAATALNVTLPNDLAKITNGSASLTVTRNGFTGGVSNLGSFSVGGGLQVNLRSLNLAWDTRAARTTTSRSGRTAR